MRRLRTLLAGIACGIAACAAPSPPPPASPPAVVSIAAPPPAAPAPEPDDPAPPAETPSPPPLPLHRFAALVPGQRTQLFAVQGRILLRAGDHLFSLSPGQVHREADLEKALSDAAGHLSAGAIGGRYPDDLVADRQIPEAGKDRTVRQYVRIRGGKAKEVGRATPDIMDLTSTSALQIVELPDARILAGLEIEMGEGTLGWLDFVPSKIRSPREEKMPGLVNAGSQPRLLPRADGSVSMIYGPWDKRTYVRWTKGAQDPEQAPLALEADERVANLFETTDGQLFLLTSKALRRQAGSEWTVVESGGSIERAWPLPDGALLLVKTDGSPLVRNAKGVLERARWPTVTIEGRNLPVGFADALCTREAGFWAVSRDGIGLYHDRAPHALVDVAKLGPGQTGGAP